MRTLKSRTNLRRRLLLGGTGRACASLVVPAADLLLWLPADGADADGTTVEGFGWPNIRAAKESAMKWVAFGGVTIKAATAAEAVEVEVRAKATEVMLIYDRWLDAGFIIYINI